MLTAALPYWAREKADKVDADAAKEKVKDKLGASTSSDKVGHFGPATRAALQQYLIDLIRAVVSTFRSAPGLTNSSSAQSRTGCVSSSSCPRSPSRLPPAVASKARLASSRSSAQRQAAEATIPAFCRRPGASIGRQSGSLSANRTLYPQTDRRRRTSTTSSLSTPTLASSVPSARTGRDCT